MALEALPALEHKRSAVRAMFDRIAPRYDAMNRVLTLGMDQRWRRHALDAIGVARGDTLIDLACGTGDLAALARARGARVIGVDFSREMLRGARLRRRDTEGVALVQGDAAGLPFRCAAASALTCGFALRNFVSLSAVLAEMARVLAPGGRLALLEVDRPRAALLRAGHSLYFDRVVPRVGGLLSDRQAYRYLPQSTSYLPDEPTLRAAIRSAGFTDLAKRALLFGSAQILTAVRT